MYIEQEETEANRIVEEEGEHSSHSHVNVCIPIQYSSDRYCNDTMYAMLSLTDPIDRYLDEGQGVLTYLLIYLLTLIN